MANWKLELMPNPLHTTYPYFFSLKERIVRYQDFFLTPASDTPHGKDFPGALMDETASQPSPAGSDDRKSETPFSTLFALYADSGDEYTFSRRGMRHVKRIFPWQGHYHTHNYIEILYVAQGSFEQILLGERQKFEAGEFVITDRSLEHADYLSGSCSACVLFLSLKSDYLDALLTSHDRGDELQKFFFRALQRQRKEQSYLHLRPAALTASNADLPPRTELSRLMETLIAEDWNPTDGSADIIRGNLIRLFSILCRDYSMQLHTSDQEGKEKAFLYELERYIRIHAGQVTCRELEEVFHYHRNYYNSLLQKHQGITFQKYVQHIRLKHAAGLLVTTSLPIREVAIRCGWHNNSHFYHLFESCYGMSPSDYRRQHFS